MEARISRGGRELLAGEGEMVEEERESRVWMTGARMKMPGKGIEGSSNV